MENNNCPEKQAESNLQKSKDREKRGRVTSINRETSRTKPKSSGPTSTTAREPAIETKPLAVPNEAQRSKMISIYVDKTSSKDDQAHKRTNKVIYDKDPEKKKIPKETKNSDNLAQQDNLDLPSDSRRYTPKRVRTDQIPEDKIWIDPVIEQWYADPYNRYDPEGAAGLKLRKETLTTALRNRGFRGPRVASIVSWLVRCNGQFRSYDEPPKPGKRRASRRLQGTGTDTKYKLNIVPQKLTNESFCTAPESPMNYRPDRYKVEERAPDIDFAAYPSPKSAVTNLGNISEPGYGSDNSTSNISTTYATARASLNNKLEGNEDAPASEDEDIEDDQDDEDPLAEAAIQQLKEELKAVRPSFRSRHGPDTQEYQDDYDDWRLEDLKRTQEFWNIIYGDDLDDVPKTLEESESANNEAYRVDDGKGDGEETGKITDVDEVKFTYFRDPRGMPTVDVQYRSQGLKPVTRVMMGNKEVWTEDKNFGLYVPATNEKLDK